MAFSGQFAGKPDSGDHGGGIGLVFPGDREGGAVVRAGAGFRQAQGDVYGVVEIEQFERDEALVVIHRDDGIEVAERRIPENRIGHSWTGEMRFAQVIQAADGGSDDPGFLIAESTVLAGVRIESCDGDPGLVDAAAFEKGGGEQTGADDSFDAEQRGDFRERFMDGGERDGERVSGQHHAEIQNAECIRKIFGLAGEGESEGLQAFFGNRAGDDSIRRAAFQLENRLVESGHGGGGRAGVGFAGNSRVSIADDFEFEVLRQFSGGHGLIDDFRADSGGVSQGDQDAWHVAIIHGSEDSAKLGIGGR